MATGSDDGNYAEFSGLGDVQNRKHGGCPHIKVLSGARNMENVVAVPILIRKAIWARESGGRSVNRQYCSRGGE